MARKSPYGTPYKRVRTRPQTRLYGARKSGCSKFFLSQGTAHPRKGPMVLNCIRLRFPVPGGIILNTLSWLKLNGGGTTAFRILSEPGFRDSPFRNLTGFFTRSPDIAVKPTDGNPVFCKPLAFTNPAGSAPSNP